MPLIDVDGCKAIVLAGTPEDMGREHGALLKGRIQSVIEHFVKKGNDVHGVPYSLMKQVAEHLKPHIPERFLIEADSLARAATVTLDDVLIGNTMIDADAILMQNYFNCTNFVVVPPATKGDLHLHGRNLDFPTIELFKEYAIVVVRLPADIKRQPTLAISWCGHLGMLTGCNRDQIIATHVMAPTSEPIKPGVPMTIMMRAALEQSASLDDFYAYVQENPRSAGYNLAVSDGKNHLGISIEATRQLCERRALRKGLLVVDNVSLCKKTAANRLTHAAGVFRYARMKALLKEHYGQIGIEESLSFLRDRYDIAHDSTATRTYNTICNHHTIQSALFVPSQNFVLVSHTEIPAPTGVYSTIPLTLLNGVIEDRQSHETKSEDTYRCNYKI